MNNHTIQVKPSFFDDSSPAEYTIWKKGIFPKKTSETRIVQGTLFKRSSRTNFWKSRFYVLFEDRIAYYKNARETQEKGYCLIQNMRVEKIYLHNEKDIYGIKLVHNGLSCDIYARSKELQEKWIQALAKHCVLTFYSSCFVNIKVIGKGSFARVFLAKRRSNGMELAVKTFDKNLLASSEKAKASLINEVNIMRRLEHENMIKLYEVYESDNHIYLVLELLNGGELFDRVVRKGQYSEKDACVLMRNLLSAISYMHSMGIMHRDIKPENLILRDSQNDMDIKIADFGLATPINCNEYLFKRCGTPGYVAPEILEDEDYDEKVDVFSAGVILYILLTGGSPFHGNTYEEIIWKNKNCVINYNFEQYGLQISDSAIDLMKKMLTKDPEERISASEAFSHPWIATREYFYSSQSMSPVSLSSTQENMRIFQEEHRENAKAIKTQNVDQAALEKAGHAPSPLINGRMVTMADSKDHFYLNSPDVRNHGILQSQEQGCISLESTSDDLGDQSMLAEEIKFFNANLNGYRDENEHSLLSKFTYNDQANIKSFKDPSGALHANSSVKNTKKAMNVQGSLLKYLSSQIQDKKPQNSTL